MMDTKTAGDISEAQILAALVASGRRVLVPWGDNQRYDLAIDDGGVLVRVQVKTGRLVGGCVEFKTASTYAHRGRGVRGYDGEADLFGVFCPELGTSYLVPVIGAARASMRLRLDPTRNSQTVGVRWAREFVL